jgi:hypothetical protein
MRRAIEQWQQGERGPAVRGFFRREWPAIVVMLGAILLTIGFHRIEATADEAHDAAVLAENTAAAQIKGQIEGCEKVRRPQVRYYAAREDALTAEIERLLAIPRSGFPGLTDAQFQSLIRSNEQQLNRELSTLRTVAATADPERCADQFQADPR